jgi:6-phosphogluconate dehydrogenase
MHVNHCDHTLLAGKWTVQQAAELSVPSPTIEAALDGRFLSGLKDQRVKAAAFYEKYGVHAPSVRAHENTMAEHLAAV